MEVVVFFFVKNTILYWGPVKEGQQRIHLSFFLTWYHWSVLPVAGRSVERFHWGQKRTVATLFGCDRRGGVVCFVVAVFSTDLTLEFENNLVSRLGVTGSSTTQNLFRCWVDH